MPHFHHILQTDNSKISGLNTDPSTDIEGYSRQRNYVDFKKLDEEVGRSTDFDKDNTVEDQENIYNLVSGKFGEGTKSKFTEEEYE